MPSEPPSDRNHGNFLSRWFPRHFRPPSNELHMIKSEMVNLSCKRKTSEHVSPSHAKAVSQDYLESHPVLLSPVCTTDNNTHTSNTTKTRRNITKHTPLLRQNYFHVHSYHQECKTLETPLWDRSSGVLRRCLEEGPRHRTMFYQRPQGLDGTAKKINDRLS